MFDLKKLLGLTSVSDAESALRQVVHHTQKKMADKLASYHIEYDKEQQDIEFDFKYQSLKDISINIDDDFYDDGYVPDGEIQSTYARIENSDIPDCECYKILVKISDYIRSNELLPNNIKMSIRFYDATHQYPILINEHAYILNKNWKLHFDNITHENLEELLPKLKYMNEINSVPLVFYSES